MDVPLLAKRLSLLPAVALAGLLTLFCFSATADDRFSPEEYGGLGGVLPVKNDVYRAACGACHFTYSPGMLPARSWELILSKSDNHFGKKLTMTPEVTGNVRSYLLDNAADKSPYKGSQQLMVAVSPSVTPMRITQLPEMIRKHRVVMTIRTSVKALTNCNDCHLHPEQGSFVTDDYIIPGTNPGMGPDLHNAEKPPTG